MPLTAEPRSPSEFGLEGPVERWGAVAREIHDDVCANGYDAELGCFVQSYGSKWLDGSLLLIPTTGFLPPDDPRILGTVRAVEERLLQDGFVMRHDPAEVETGLAHGEGAFLACTFWLADAMVLTGGPRRASGYSTGCSRCATTSACCRKSTTWARDAWSATSRRRSRTSRSSTPPTTSPAAASPPSSVLARRRLRVSELRLSQTLMSCGIAPPIFGTPPNI